MHLILSGIHQRTAPVAIREQLAFEPELIPSALAALRTYADEAWLLSTCNRVELYALVADDADQTPIRQFLANWHGLLPEDLDPYLYDATDTDVVRHLFRLAAGLDSMVLGEEQILAQIKGALQDADAAGSLGPNMHRLVESALAAGKLVRTETGIARMNLSVVSVAVDLARQAGGPLSEQRVLIIGAGRMAELALKHLHATAKHVTVSSRTPERAEALATRFGASSATLDNLPLLLSEHDTVFCCTSAAGTIIDADMLVPIVPTHPLVLLDLAVPRDIDARVAELSNVTLFDVDGMQAICDANRAARIAEIDSAEALVQQEVEKFSRWWTNQKVVPTIRALRERAESIRAAELERTLARLSHLGPQEQAAINALSAAIVNKLLHQPISTLKNPDHGDELSRALQQLFQL